MKRNSIAKQISTTKFPIISPMQYKKAKKPLSNCLTLPMDAKNNNRKNDGGQLIQLCTNVINHNKLYI